MNKNVPVIRFKEFTDNWEQRKFSDLYAPLVERNSDLLPYNKTLSVATMTYKTDGNGAADSSLANYKRLRTGDIAFEGHTSKSFRYGRFVLNDVGDGIMSPRFSALRPLAQMPTNFWKYYIHYEPIMRKVLVASTKAGTMMNELVIDEFLKSSVLVPSIEEQTRIGSILKNIDNLITLHQQKLEKLINVRANMFERLFPRGTDKVPGIRFKKFKSDWEERTLGSIVTPYTDYLPTPDNGYMRLGLRSFMKGTFYEYVEAKKRLGEKRLQRVKKDNLIVNIVFAWEHAIAVTTEEDEGKLVSHRFPQFSFNEGMYPRFFHYALGDERFRHHLWLASPSGAGRNKTLRINEMLEYKLLVPKYEEQKRITDYLDSIDQLVELYGQRIEKLKNIKAACLDGMFI